VGFYADRPHAMAEALDTSPELFRDVLHFACPKSRMRRVTSAVAGK
jgi:hypothetical protein